MFHLLLDWLNADETVIIPMQHDGIYALMSWRDLLLARQNPPGPLGNDGWLLLLILALWLPVLFLV
jgi:hypothetical protein